jgi:anti-sigma-K factor RskA
MTHADASELLGAYALGVLSTQEHTEMEAHLETCTTCAGEAQRLQSVSDSLALVAPEREPPPALRARLVALVEQDRAQWLQQQPVTVAGRLKEQRGAVAGRPRAAWWMRGRRIAYGAGAALVAAAVLILVLVLHQQNVSVKTYQTVVASRVVRGVRLHSVTAAIDVRSDHTTAVRFANLPVLPSTLAYELWLIPARGAPVPVDGFEVQADRAYSHTYARDASGYAFAAVSIERAPGRWPSPSPNGIAFVVSLTT